MLHSGRKLRICTEKVQPSGIQTTLPGNTGNTKHRTNTADTATQVVHYLTDLINNDVTKQIK